MSARTMLIVPAFCAFLAWRGAASLAACSRELLATEPAVVRAALTWSEEQRIRATLAERDRRVGARPGISYELYRAMLDHVESEGQIHALAEPGRGKNVLGPLHFLAFPRVILRLESLRFVDTPVEHVYVLDFEGAHEDALAANCSVVVRGPDWSLWRP